MESPLHTSVEADLAVKAFDDVVGADARLVLIGQSRVCQRFLQSILNLFCRLRKLHLTQGRNHIPFFSLRGSAALLGMDGL